MIYTGTTIVPVFRNALHHIHERLGYHDRDGRELANACAPHLERSCVRHAPRPAIGAEDSCPEEATYIVQLTSRVRALSC